MQLSSQIFLRGKSCTICNKSHIGGGMILCFQTTDLSKNFLQFKFDKN